MKIFLLRHGTAEDLPGGGDSPDRRLVAKGHKQGTLVADFFQRMGVRIDRVLCSPYLRARETAEIVVERCAPKLKLELVELLQPMGSVDAAIEVIAECEGESTCVLAVGHEPLLSHIAAVLIGDRSAGIALKKAGIVELELVNRHPPRAYLLGLLRPRHLDA